MPLPRNTLTTSEGNLAHLPALDGVRGIAILAVLAVHTRPPLAQGGFIGVDLFFVLSGFLITSLLVREHLRHGSINLVHFFLRRGLRLLPALLSVLTVLWMGTLIFGSATDVRVLGKDTRAILCYAHNWRVLSLERARVEQTMTIYTAHFWSLAVEEQFYLLWPMVFAGLMAFKVRRRWVVGLAVLGVVVPPIMRFLRVHASALPLDDLKQFYRIYMGTDTRADCLSAGCLLGLLAGWWAGPRRQLALLAVRVAGILAAGLFAWHAFAVCPLERAYLFHGGFAVVALSSAVMLAALVWSPPPLLSWGLQMPPLRWLGRISYGTYLWHFPIALVLRQRVAPNYPEMATVLLLVGGVAAGALSHYVVEQPFLRLKRRLERPATTLADRQGETAFELAEAA